MSVYGYDDGIIIYEATVYGHLDNGPGITEPPPASFAQRDMVYEAARAVIPFAQLDFHLIYRHPDDGAISRMRWALGAELLGPSLNWYEDTSGDSAMMFRLLQTVAETESTGDPERPMPFGDLQDFVSAALARHVLGQLPREIPLEGNDPMTFTAANIGYTRDRWTTVTAPYSDPVYGWTFAAEPTDPYEPALWVVPVGQQDGVKVSVCRNSNGDQWSEFTEPAPGFEPLSPPGT